MSTCQESCHVGADRVTRAVTAFGLASHNCDVTTNTKQLNKALKLLAVSVSIYFVEISVARLIN